MQRSGDIPYQRLKVILRNHILPAQQMELPMWSLSVAIGCHVLVAFGGFVRRNPLKLLKTLSYHRTTNPKVRGLNLLGRIGCGWLRPANRKN